MDTCLTFAVDRADLARTTVLDTPVTPPAPGEVLLRIDSFALTANNTTYADTGDRLGYWRFFPQPAPWGAVPAWGYGNVIASACDGIPVGERLYGFLPMATHVHLRPERIEAGSLVDASPHRAGLPSAYQLYLRAPAAPPAQEGLQALLRPVFVTAFLIDDLLSTLSPAPELVVLTSASSKTALSLAWLLHRRGVAVAGLTSAANEAFVRGLGCHGVVLAYDHLDALPRSLCTATVDFAGSAPLRQRVRAQLDDPDGLRLAVGFTHRDPAPEPDPPTFFFAPDRIRQRGRDWGREGLAQRVDAAWDGFAAWAGPRLRLQHGRGPEAVGEVYRALLAGKVPADTGHVVSMAEQDVIPAKAGTSAVS